MTHYTKEQIEKMDLATAMVEIEQAVYNAALLFERLEGVRKVSGNGHHMAQNIAAQAKDLMVERWVGEKDVEDKYLDVIKSIMPKNAEINKYVHSTEHVFHISWLLEDDPARKNKRSKGIRLAITKEAMSDFGGNTEGDKKRALFMLHKIISANLAGFDPTQNTPRNDEEPVEKWAITSKDLFG